MLNYFQKSYLFTKLYLGCLKVIEHVSPSVRERTNNWKNQNYVHCMPLTITNCLRKCHSIYKVRNKVFKSRYLKVNTYLCKTITH